MAQVVGGVIGAAIGSVFGPAGMAIGFSLGSALGGAMQTIPGARIGEIARQTAKEGDPRTIVWGIVRPIGPNVIASQDPPRIERRRQSGKGGPRVETESVYRTYALGVCEGPITGYRRIWRNNKLVYDARAGSEWGEENNFVFLERATLYLGDFEQMPDPSLEIVFGVGNVPAHRGTAYIVMADEDLTDLGGAIPQWTFEVYRSENSETGWGPGGPPPGFPPNAVNFTHNTDIFEIIPWGFGTETTWDGYPDGGVATPVSYESNASQVLIKVREDRDLSTYFGPPGPTRPTGLYFYGKISPGLSSPNAASLRWDGDIVNDYLGSSDATYFVDLTSDPAYFSSTYKWELTNRGNWPDSDGNDGRGTISIAAIGLVFP